MRPRAVHEARVPKADEGALALSLLLPMLLIVMSVMGSFFPAVDLTAGEKERTTVETTLVLPVRRLAVQPGKILAVCAASVLATALKGGPAFKNVVVNGIVLAEDGEKMSKSKRNFPDPNLVLEKIGADALRIYLASSPEVEGVSGSAMGACAT